MIFTLTDTYKKTLGLDTSTSKRHGGIEHEYWKQKYAEKYQEKGYEITLEYPIGNGKAVDVVAEKGNEKIAIEIETGRSNIEDNISKCISLFSKIVVVFTKRNIDSSVMAIDKQENIHFEYSWEKKK